MQQNKLTIRDIAKLAGVSYTSVSRALSGAAGVSNATRKKVLAVCTQTGYTPNYTARSLACKKSRMLGLIVGNIDNPFCSSLAHTIELHARKFGYTLILCASANSPEQEAEMFRLLLGRMMDGVIIVPASDSSCKKLSPFLKQVPSLFIGEVPPKSKVNYVTTNYYGGMQLATHHLQQLGHSKIVYVGRRKHNVTHELRAEGYSAAMHEKGLDSLIFNNPTLASTIEEGSRLAKKVFAEHPQTTAIVAATDMIALGVMQAADQAGIEIPEDISLVSFDNIPFAALPRIQLTTVHQPTTEMAEMAVELLIHTIEHPNSTPVQKVLQPRLSIRNTTKKRMINK